MFEQYHHQLRRFLLNVRVMMKRRDISRVNLAQHLSVTKSTVSKILHGESQLTLDRMMMMISHFVGADLGYMLAQDLGGYNSMSSEEQRECILDHAGRPRSTNHIPSSAKHPYANTSSLSSFVPLGAGH
jgi:transcriptional regulator with XRE-family HTH domain